MCCDGTLYTGITINLEKRVEEHNTSPKGAKYTRARRPVTLVHHEMCETKSEALKRERVIKQLSREKKQLLIANSSAMLG